ncbi:MULTISPECIES: hypothetical protein [Cobetia]|jgi:hypothetical protein|uniref:Multidrug transporter n=1 Tax=Cobetia marina TaxID=28258 RepID=A0ABU9GJE5_COBMA|nr:MULTISPECIES: hypothetical protein [Cobetia]MDA5564918.1 hypothetical protein [Cobetia sp. MMG027]MDI6004818.1 hypothetical protein [Cobetia pacifica]GED41613.1 hypothetical protein HHA02_09420 [Cobetia marina]
MKTRQEGWLGLVAGGVMTLAMAMPAQALDLPGEPEQSGPGAGAMVADALIGRPLLLLTTVAGTAVFLVSAPFAALGGNLDATAETLVKTPAEATFRRCLGCEMSRRAEEM